MTLHLVKLCVGAESVADLEEWVEKRALANERSGRGRIHDHVTRMFPRREKELLEKGSVYWVIKGVVQARQRIVGLEKRRGADEIERCAILLEPSLVLTEPQPKRAFQGWRYLREEDAPADLRNLSGGKKAPPPELNIKLAELGLL